MKRRFPGPFPSSRTANCRNVYTRHSSATPNQTGSLDTRGYKLHLDVADGQIPITCLLTTARLHDSQVAIPLAALTASRVTSLYDLMDAAYDANEIHAHSRSLGHVPLISPAPRYQFTCEKVKPRKNSYATKIVRGVRPTGIRPLRWAEEDRL